MAFLYLRCCGHGVGYHFHHRFFLADVGAYPIQCRNRGYECQWCFYCCQTGCRWQENGIVLEHDKRPLPLLFNRDAAFFCMTTRSKILGRLLAQIPNKPGSHFRLVDISPAHPNKMISISVGSTTPLRQKVYKTAIKQL